MDDALKVLADAGLALEAAEESLDAGEATVAEERLAEVDDLLEAVRSRWPELSPAVRGIAGPAGKSVRARRDALVKRLPVRRAVSEGAPVAPDPEEEQEPDV